MITIHHYIRLFLYFAGITTGKQHELSIKQVSDILFCTDRNSRLIVKRFEEENWIKWMPGKGRGNRSMITFLVYPDDLLLRQAKEMVGRGQLREARKMIEEYSVQFPLLKGEFDHWVESLFGFHTATGQKANQDTLRLKFSKLPVNPLDPNKISLRSECHIVRHVCDTLVIYNKETAQIEPRLAFYWESTDQITWTFYLRKGVLFHDGQTLTAEDVVSTFKRTFKNENLYSWMVDTIDVVRSLNDYTVEFILKAPNHYFLYLLCDEHLSILSRKQEEQSIHTSIIGTGPYQLVQNDENALVMEAFDAYFLERPFLDRVEYWYSPEEGFTNSQEPLNVNDLLWVGVYPPQRTDKIPKHRQEQTILERNVQFLSLNVREDSPLADPFLRSVLKEIIDPSFLIRELAGDRGEVASGFLPNTDIPLVAKGKSIEQLLKESRYSGKPLHLYTFDDWDHHEDVDWIIDRCEPYGITIHPKFLSDEELLKIDVMQQADIIHDSASMGEQFEVSFFHLILADNSFIYNHLSKEYIMRIKEMVKHFYGEPSAKRRLEILQDIEQLLIGSNVVIPLYRNEAYVNSDERVQNVKVNTQGWIDFTHIWFKQINEGTKHE